jgi:hypothetical protein
MPHAKIVNGNCRDATVKFFEPVVTNCAFVFDDRYIQTLSRDPGMAMLGK